MLRGSGACQADLYSRLDSQSAESTQQYSTLPCLTCTAGGPQVSSLGLRRHSMQRPWRSSEGALPVHLNRRDVLLLACKAGRAVGRSLCSRMRTPACMMRVSSCLQDFKHTRVCTQGDLNHLIPRGTWRGTWASGSKATKRAKSWKLTAPWWLLSSMPTMRSQSCSRAGSPALFRSAICTALAALHILHILGTLFIPEAMPAAPHRRRAWSCSRLSSAPAPVTPAGPPSSPGLRCMDCCTLSWPGMHSRADGIPSLSASVQPSGSEAVCYASAARGAEL